ncbi:hypothetical protein Hdeb2414_s0011g00365681 [Helianthus debilis subsp. tardiflorus]
MIDEAERETSCSEGDGAADKSAAAGDSSDCSSSDSHTQTLVLCLPCFSGNRSRKLRKKEGGDERERRAAAAPPYTAVGCTTVDVRYRFRFEVESSDQFLGLSQPQSKYGQSWSKSGSTQLTRSN